MGIRDLLKQAAFLALGSGMRMSTRAEALRGRKVRVVLSLHRVNEPDSRAQRALHPKMFRELLKFLSREFRLQTFRDGPEGPAVILSFDDGYKDFIEVVAPILREFKIRCNQNVIPECVETGLPPLNVLAQDFVGTAPRELVRRLDLPGFRVEGRNLGSRLSSFLKNKPQVQQRELAEQLLPQFFSWDDFKPTRMMNRADVLAMSTEHEIGAHSYSHATMLCESPQYLQEDVKRCKEYFSALGLPMDIYAFPNGSCELSQVRTVESAGVSHVLLVSDYFDTHPSHHFRFNFHARSPSEMRFKALGGFQQLPTSQKTR